MFLTGKIPANSAEQLIGQVALPLHEELADCHYWKVRRYKSLSNSGCLAVDNYHVQHPPIRMSRSSPRACRSQKIMLPLVCV